MLTEPAELDNTYAVSGETTWDWLHRSTVARAVECRRFVNEQLLLLPEEFQVPLLQSLKRNWASGFFELITACSLQLLGATIKYENFSVGRSVLDFHAQFEDEEIVIEAKSPVYQKLAGEQMKRNQLLMPILKRNLPAGWAVTLWSVPPFEPCESKASFRLACEKLRQTPPPRSADERREVILNSDKGPLRFTLLATKSGRSHLVNEPLVSYFSDAVPSISKAVRRKRRQIRGTQLPCLLAIRGEDLGSSLDDFDVALFGSECEHLDIEGTVVDRSFTNDGVFRRRGEGEPSIGGVLAYPQVGFLGAQDPVLYLHPRYKRAIPAALSKLEIRTMESDRIKIRPASKPIDLASRINWVRRDV